MIMTSFAEVVESVRQGQLDVDAAAQRLLDQLTANERLGLLDGDATLWRTIPKMTGGRHGQVHITAGAVNRLGIPGIKFTDGPRGVVRGSSTSFPVALARAATFDPQLEERVGTAIGKEGRANEANLFGGICVNALRHPGWGRSQESYGEDPVVLGRMGAALARGVAPWMMTCVKHFAVNSMEEMRFAVDVEVDEADLHEWYLPHFKAVIDAGVDSVMTSYNQVNGAWAGESRPLIQDILRDEWGFTGFVQSDWVYGFRDSVASVQAGMDLEMPFRQQRARDLPKALRAGRLLPAEVDACGLRVLAGQIRYAVRAIEDDPDPAVVAGPEHRALAREVASRSAILLRNEVRDGTPVLPLDPDGLTTVAVLGRLADEANLGDAGSSIVQAPSTCSVLVGLTEALGAARVVTADPTDTAGSAAAAAKADAAVVVVGLTADDEGEYLVSDDPGPLSVYGPIFRIAPVAKAFAWVSSKSGVEVGGDRRDLGLHPGDIELIEAVAAANERTIVIVIGGGMVVMDPWRQQVGAIVVGWYPGMEGGRGLADVLLGISEPGGRLPFAVVSDPGHLPETDFGARRIRYDRWWGQRKLDRDGHRAAYPFGFGLGYTTFELGDLELSGDGEHRATVAVRNTGPRPGGTIVQVYAVDGSLPEDRQVHHLLGFARVEAAPGATVDAVVDCVLTPISHRDPATRTWSVVDGGWRVLAAQHTHDPHATERVDLWP
jgi:beta-glucosidase